MGETSLNEGPLRDLRVVEMGQLLAGPFCAQLLGDFGAEVIKIEPPGEGDPMRVWGRQPVNGVGLWFPVVGRNKKSVTINLRKAAGQALARDLIARADVLVENFRVGTMERWGLDYDTLSAINPRLVMVRITGYGQTGPYAQRAGFGVIGEAMGGLRHVVGDPDRPPSRVGISLGDSLAGLFGALGALMAVHARQTSGRGQVVDSAIYEAVLAMMESLVPEYQHAGYVRERTGATLPNVAPSNVYPAANGQSVLIAANQDSVFRRLARAMGQPELATDLRYATHGARGQHQAELDELIAVWSAPQDPDALLILLEEHGVPAGKIFRAPEMLADPHFRAREAIVELMHPLLGRIAMHNVAPKLSLTPGTVRTAGPLLGAHNTEVFEGLLGRGRTELETLSREGVI